MINNPVYESIVTANPSGCDFRMKWKPSMFFRYATEAAMTHNAEMGFGFQNIQEQGLAWVLSRMKLKILQYPSMYDQFVLRTWPKTHQQKIFYIRDYEFVTTDGKQLALATSAWIVIDICNRRLVPPAKTCLDIPKIEDKNGLDEMLDKIVCPNTSEKRFDITAGYSCLDFVGHVNNSFYIDWVSDAFDFEHYSKKSIDWLQINYAQEITPGQTDEISRSQSQEDSDLWFVSGKSKETDHMSFASAVHWIDDPSKISDS